MFSSAIIAFANGDQKYQIQGIVLEAETGNPLPYVTVSLYLQIDSSLVTGTITDMDGKFEIDKIDKEAYFLKMSFVGFDDIIVSSIYFDDTETQINIGAITMKPASTLLNEVVIKTKSSPLSNSIDKQVINVGRNITATGGSAIDALRMSPSIEIGMDNEVTLRGSTKFIVLINNKPTTLSAQQVLSQTPANLIKQIEVITNPSVKYQAEGGAGIINIVLKSGIQQGSNGMVNTMIGNRNKFGADASYNLNLKKIQLTASANWKDYSSPANHFYDRSTINSDTSLFGYMDQSRLLRQVDYAGRINLNYQLTEKDAFSYAMHSGVNIVDLNLDYKVFGSTVPASQELYSASNFNFNQNPSFITNNISYDRTLGGSLGNISMNAYYSYIKYDMETNQVSQPTDEAFNPINKPSKLDILNDNYSNDRRINIDYSRPLGKSFNLELGTMLHNYERDLDIRFLQFNNETNVWIDHPEFTNQYSFFENVYGGYVNLQGMFSGFQASMGVRAEYMDRVLNQKSTEVRYDYHRLNWFPSVNISRAINNKHNFSFALSNRINRPDEYLMNPFPEFEDPYFYSEGNPGLIPELASNMELSYRYIHKGLVLSGNIFYRSTRDKIEQLLVDTEDGKLYTSFHNNAQEERIGFEFMTNYNPAPWLGLMLSSSTFKSNISGVVDNENIEKSLFGYQIQMVNSVQLPKHTSVQLIGFYRSRVNSLQFDILPFYFFDLGINKAFMNGKLKVGLQMKDIFDTMNPTLDTRAQQTLLQGRLDGESQIILLNVSYQINSYNKKTKDAQTEFDM